MKPGWVAPRMWDKWGWVLLAASAVLAIALKPPTAPEALLAGGLAGVLVGTGKWLAVLVSFFYGVFFLRGHHGENGSRGRTRRRT